MTRSPQVKEKIHPKWFDATVVCACGNTFKTGSTVEKLHVEICSNCHPFFTGKQKFVDTEGRVEKFVTKYGTVTAESIKKTKAAAAKAAKGRSPLKAVAAAPAVPKAAPAPAPAPEAAAVPAAAPKAKAPAKPRAPRAKAKPAAQAAAQSDASAPAPADAAAEPTSDASAPASAE